MHHAAGFADQVAVEFVFCDYPLRIPSQHVLAGFFDPRSPMYQPYRETGLVKIATAMRRLGRTGTAIDIGANVGDTCAILHRHCDLKILSIDASDFFFPYLAGNIARLFADRASARQAFVLASRSQAPQGLYHWGGTAKAVDAPFTESCGSIAIADLLAEVGDTALLKIDVDGFDIEIVSGALAEGNRTGAVRFPIFFELEFRGDTYEQIRTHAEAMVDCFAQARKAGYASAFVWDDPGRFVGRLDLDNSAGIVNAINYMGHFRHRSIYGYDVCLVHESDEAFATALRQLVSADVLLPLTDARHGR
jgi:FkbM family methyltransferase